MKGLAALTLSLCLAGCATVENGADHVRDFAEAHPVAVSVVASVVVTSAVTTYELRKADKQMAQQLGAALAGSSGSVTAPPTTVYHLAMR